MSWKYGEYFSADWNDKFELEARGSKSTGVEGAELTFEPDGTVEVMVTGGCYSCNGDNRRLADLSLEQAIELSTYINCIMIPTLMEKSETNEY